MAKRMVTSLPPLIGACDMSQLVAPAVPLEVSGMLENIMDATTPKTPRLSSRWAMARAGGATNVRLRAGQRRLS